MGKLKEYLGVRAVRLGIMAVFVATFFGAPALGYQTGNETLQKLDPANAIVSVILASAGDHDDGPHDGDDYDGMDPNGPYDPSASDMDGDGIYDDVDECPSYYGTMSNGCSEGGTATGPADSDGDGFFDDADNCIDQYGVHPTGCPDEDGDGVPKDMDECPGEIGPMLNNGCPEAGSTDSDGDGIFDDVDECKDTYALTSTGCPDAAGSGSDDGKPDLMVKDIYLGSGNVLTAELANVGTVDVTDSVGIYFYFDDTLEWTYSSSTLADQSFMEVGGYSTISPQVLDGRHAVKVCIDPDNSLEESNEENNCVEETLGEDAGKPDLAVQEVYLGSGNVVTAVLKNLGEVDVEETVRIYFYFDGDLEWTYSSSTLADQSFMEAGGSSTISPQVLDGQHEVEVCVDASNTLEELNEDNNCVVEMLGEATTSGTSGDTGTSGTGDTGNASGTDDGTASGSGMPDLTVAELYLDAGNVLTAVVKNVGDVDVTDAVRIYFYFDDNLEWSYTSSTLADQSFLEAGGSSTISPQVLDGQHEVKVCIDGRNAVAEFNEDNNCVEGIFGEGGGDDDDYYEVCDTYFEGGLECEVCYDNAGNETWNYCEDQNDDHDDDQVSDDETCDEYENEAGEWCKTCYDNDGNQTWDWCESMNGDGDHDQSVCGMDGETYESEDAAEDAGVEISYWGECGEADEWEIRDMENMLDNKANFQEVLDRAEFTLFRFENTIEDFNRYLEEGQERDLGDSFEDFVDKRIDKFQLYITEIENNIYKIVETKDRVDVFMEEAEERLDQVRSGEKGSQYFWNYMTKQDLFWIIREVAENRNMHYDDQGLFDMEGENAVRFAYEAAKQGVLDQIDWSPLEDVEDDIQQLHNLHKDLIDDYDDLELAALEVIEGPDVTDWNEWEMTRYELQDRQEDLRWDMDEYWDAKDDFWNSNPWERIDEMWEEIHMLGEMQFAVRDLEEIITKLEDQKVLEILQGLMSESYAQTAITELMDFADEVLLPAAYEALEAGTPDAIWYYMDTVLDPAEHYVRPRIELLADLYFRTPEYQEALTDEERQWIEELFGGFHGYRHDPKDLFFEEFEMGDDDADFIVAQIKSHILEDVLTHIAGIFSSSSLQTLADHSQNMDVPIDPLLEMSVYAADSDRYQSHVQNVESLLATIADLKEQVQSLSYQNQLKDIAYDLPTLYGPAADELREALEALDPSSLSQDVLDELKALKEKAIEETAQAMSDDGLIPFNDTLPGIWDTSFAADLKGRGVMDGYKDANGNPTGESGRGDFTTNAEALKLLWGSTGHTPSGSYDQFPNHWATAYYDAFDTAGYMDTGLGTPDNQIPRGMVARIAARLLSDAGVSKSGEATCNFSDIEGEYKDDVMAICEYGVMTGDDGSTNFRPYDGLVRAEMFKVVAVVLELYEGNVAADDFEDFNVDEFADELNEMDLYGSADADGAVVPHGMEAETNGAVVPHGVTETFKLAATSVLDLFKDLFQLQ